MRWPFGPPHLTLKPSKKNKTQKNKKKNKTKKTKQKNTKKNKKNQNKERKSKKHKNPQKRAFQLSIKIFFFDRVSKNCLFLTPWPRKRAPKNTIELRVSAYFFWKEVMRHETAIFGQKKPQIINSSYHFFLPFFSLSKTKNTIICWNPYFYSVLANPKKDNFPKINLKHRNLKNPIFAPIFWKRLFLDNCQIIGHKNKPLNDNCVCKKSLETTIFIG